MRHENKMKNHKNDKSRMVMMMVWAFSSLSTIISILLLLIIIIMIVSTIINIFIIIIWFLTLVLASISAPFSRRVRTTTSWPFWLAAMRAVSPYYNNNEEMRHENKIKNKKHKNDISRMVMMMTIVLINKITIMMVINSTMWFMKWWLWCNFK